MPSFEAPMEMWGEETETPLHWVLDDVAVSLPTN
jgi:hypothetical protein